MQAVTWLNGWRQNSKENNSNLKNYQEMGMSNQASDNEYVGKHQFLEKKDVRNAALLKTIGHEAMVMDKIMRQNKIVENTVHGVQNQSGMDTSNPSGDEEDMGVSIGNETHYHYQQQTPVPPKQDANNTSSKNNWGIPVSIIAAGAMTGAGLYFKDDPNNNIQDVPKEVIEDNSADLIFSFDEPKPINNT